MSDENKTKAAFPVYAKDDGMTLRDYFAAAALIGMTTRVQYDATPKQRAIMAYIEADAMLVEREKGAADTAAATG